MSTTIDSTSSTLTSYTSSATGSNTIGKEDFLTLLVAQLENQDPLDPTDTNEFVAQLTDYSMLEQNITTNEKLDELVSTMESGLSSLSAYQLLGQEIVAETETVTYQGEALEVGFDLEEDATTATLEIQDSTGATVASLNLTDLAAGEQFVTWSGEDDEGNAVAYGDYTLVVTATNDDGAVEATPLVKTTVDALRQDSLGSVLETAAGDLTANQVVKVATN